MMYDRNAELSKKRYAKQQMPVKQAILGKLNSETEKLVTVLCSEIEAEHGYEPPVTMAAIKKLTGEGLVQAVDAHSVKLTIIDESDIDNLSQYTA